MGGATQVQTKSLQLAGWLPCLSLSLIGRQAVCYNTDCQPCYATCTVPLQLSFP